MTLQISSEACRVTTYGVTRFHTPFTNVACFWRPYKIEYFLKLPEKRVLHTNAIREKNCRLWFHRIVRWYFDFFCAFNVRRMALVRNSPTTVFIIKCISTTPTLFTHNASSIHHLLFEKLCDKKKFSGWWKNYYKRSNTTKCRNSPYDFEELRLGCVK